MTRQELKGSGTFFFSSPFSRIEGGEAIVAVHELPDASRYALVVNRSFTQAVTLRLTLQDWVKNVRDTHLPPPGTDFLTLPNRQATLRLPPGAPAFLRLGTSS